MVKKLRDSVALYPRRLEASNVDRMRVKLVVEALQERSAVHTPAAQSSSTVRLRAKRSVAARSARRRMSARPAP